ncbi:LysR family transcriptional regulator [Comamonas composti]|uniref:LysR family transcriptional regulator n=1 Tax=Comamonas composti TaxID=408558 RepID=UPI00047AB4E6|nr:LysR family transcriptional regulator [Comamonas composti]
MHIHARAIRYFDMIRRCGSIREAARHLHVASSAINRQLLQLEDQIGSPLFERLSTGLKLTAAGEIFARHVITVLQDECRLGAELELLRGVHRGSVHVAAVEGLNADLIPAVLTQMHELHPGVQVHVRTCGSQQAAQAVIQGEADVAMGFSIQPHEHLHPYATGRFALGAIVPPLHPLAQFARVNFAQCAAYPLILPTPHLSMHALLQPLIMRHRRALQVWLETSSLELAKTMVESGTGLFFQTRLGLARELRERRLVHLPLKSPALLAPELGIYVRAGRSLCPALDAFNRIASAAIDRRQKEEVALLHKEQACRLD